MMMMMIIRCWNLWIKICLRTSPTFVWGWHWNFTLPQWYMQFQLTLMFLFKRNYGFSEIIYEEFLYLIVSPFFCIWISQQESPPKKVYPISTASHTFPTPPETSPEGTWVQSFIANFPSFNPRQYESHHHEQDLLITTSKISYYLLQLQIIKVIKFQLRSACYYKFHAPMI